MTSSARNNTHQINGGHERTKIIKKLPIKKFEIRESLITTLYENPHLKVVKHIFAASLVGLFINTVAHDYLENGEIRIGFRVITAGFGKFHLVAGIWLLLNICAILAYFCFSLWANVRIHIPPKAQNVKIWDTMWLMSVPAYYVLQFRMISIVTRSWEMPIASSSILCLEQTRLLMKIHAYIRSNTEKVTLFKPHAEKELKLASLSHFVYFLFAPTLVYRDEYPRTKTIRWNFVSERILELVGVIFYYAFLLERFLIPTYKDIGLRPYFKSELVLIVCENFAVGLLFLLNSFYLVLHVVQNLSGELLRFGDRQFYSDWWTSTNYSTYFRSWNMVVGDWLYTYIYKDCYELVVPGNKTIAKLIVFTISAIVHEWVLTYMFGFFFPALFLAFFFSGGVLSFLKTPKMDFVNILFWYALASGSGTLISLYSMEYFVRVNLPVESTSLRDFIIPRLFTCNCIT